ncbi:MAG: hypothetical protein J6J71_04635 [Prevotella sp.]|nr:hypothetical protein [Prevotella sp.]
MSLKKKCDEFLANLTDMRKSAIEEAVQKELREKHEPYKSQMITARDTALANEERAFNLAVEQLRIEHLAKAKNITSDFEEAISAHKLQVEKSASESAKFVYDNVILKISAIADEIK